MELDDPAVLTALSRTAAATLKTRGRRPLDDAAAADAERAEAAIALVARARHAGPTSWATAEIEPSGGSFTARARALRPHVATRLAVTNPGYAAEVDGAPR